MTAEKDTPSILHQFASSRKRPCATLTDPDLRIDVGGLDVGAPMTARFVKTHYIGAGEPAHGDKIRTTCGRVAWYDLDREADTARGDRLGVTWDAREVTCHRCILLRRSSHD